MITASTEILALIGNPVGHSMGPLVHNAALRARSLNMVYVAHRVSDAGAAIAAMRVLGIRGYSVTIPHKESVGAFVDELDPGARMTGSVNTIVNERGNLRGYSTDGEGAVRALRRAGADPRGRACTILGSGGAARAIAFALAAFGAARIEIRARNRGKASRLEADLSAYYPGLVASKEMSGGILINATPIGMTPDKDAVPMPPVELREFPVVMDIVYNPIETALLKTVKASGALAIDGVGMFVEQAALQFELFTGADAPLDLMEQLVRDELARRNEA